MSEAVFLTAVFLALAYDVLGTSAGLYLQPIVMNWLSGLIPQGSDQMAFLGNFNAESFYGNVIQNLIDFAVVPVIFLCIFYRLGSRLKANLNANYLQLLEYSFFDGAVGYLLGYFLTVGII